MRLLQWLLIIVGSLIVLFLLVALLLPSEFRVERSIVIEATPETVFEQVVDLNNWPNWSPWNAKEPTAEYTVSGTQRGVGAVSSWKGEVIGTGTLKIVEVEEFSMIKSHLAFVEPMESESVDIWTFAPGAGGTEVVWAEEGELDYPFGRFFGLGMDSMLGDDMQKGLEALKRYIESLPEDSPELIDGALSEDDRDPNAVPEGHKETGNPDVRYEHKPYEEAKREGDARREERGGNRFPDAKKADPPK